MIHSSQIGNILDPKEISSLYTYFYDLVDTLPLSNTQNHLVTTCILLLGFSLTMLIIDFTLKNIFIKIVKIFASKSKTTLDDLLVKNNFFNFLTHLIPIVLAKTFFPIIFKGFPTITSLVITITDVLFVIAVYLILRSFIRSTRDYAKTKPSLLDKPIDSYSQVGTIMIFCISAMTIFTIITGIESKTFLTYLGASSAILMLVFKDTIMGFVASIQVSTNDMVRVGDWIEMTKFGADGTVLEINLSTVKVQNFDKTITTIPTYLLISDSFKNYRGMQNSGGRRIKRHINIKMASVRFLDESEINELKKIHLLKDYIEERQQEITAYNLRTNADQTMPVNGRRITNLGLFRAYVLRYVQQNPHVHQDYFIMVRHLQPTQHGIPVELYLFTNSTQWAFYETVMADIFDHVLASVDYFHLEVFELPSSDDIRDFIEQKVH